MQIKPWGLAFPERLPDGSWLTVTVVGTECATEQAAQTLLFDRTANGDAFPGEFVQAPTAAQRAGMSA